MSETLREPAVRIRSARHYRDSLKAELASVEAKIAAAENLRREILDVEARRDIGRIRAAAG
jgi:hypothetical protein